MCVTCDGSKDSSLTIKLNQDVLKDVSVEKGLDCPVKQQEGKYVNFLSLNVSKLVCRI